MLLSESTLNQTEVMTHMKKSLKKLLAILTISSLCVGAFVGCSKKDETTNANNNQTVEVNKEENKEETKEENKEETVGAEVPAEESTDSLVVYAGITDTLVNGLIPAFEEATGVKVEVITGSTSELLKRIESEQDNPYADIMIGGTQQVYIPYIDLFAEYTSANDAALLAGHKTYEGKLTPFCTESAIIMWNTNLIGDIKIESYDDLLNPELKGKIAFSDPASTGSGSGMIADLLYLKNGQTGYDGEAGWDFVTKFVDQLDGKVYSSSGQSHKAVADGEMTITRTFESAAFSYLASGAPVAVCYPTDGVNYADAYAAMVKNCVNSANAKKFLDFVTSEEAQGIIGTELCARPVREGAATADYIPDISTIVTFEFDAVERANQIQDIIAKYNEIFADLQ